MTPDISIVVPHLNQPEQLARLIESLFAQSAGIGLAEIVVVDNGSRRLPREIVERYPGVRLATEAVPGPGPARNRGVALSTAPILAFTDADCVADPGWMAAILARFAADPRLEAIGGDVRVLVADARRPTAAEAYEMLYAFPQKRYIQKMRFSGSGNFAVRRAVFDAVGPFAGINVAEDMDWGRRATALGHRIVYAPEMIVHHPARGSLGEIYTKWDRNISHHYAAFAGGVVGKARWLARTAIVGLSPLAEVPRILGSRRLAGPLTRWRAFRGMTAIRLYRMRKMIEVMVRQETQLASAQWNRQ